MAELKMHPASAIMRIAVHAVVFPALVGCVDSGAPPRAEHSGQPVAEASLGEGPSRTAVAHGGALLVAARFFCAQNRWPSDLAELQRFHAADVEAGATKLDWAWLLGQETAYATSPAFRLYTRSMHGAQGWMSAETTQEPPACGRRTVTLTGASIRFDGPAFRNLAR